MKRAIDRMKRPPPACGYGCGKPSEGYLMLSFSEWDASVDGYNRGFNTSLPACRDCLKGAVKIKVVIPDVQVK